jgi:hypothetical protein
MSEADEQTGARIKRHDIFSNIYLLLSLDPVPS